MDSRREMAENEEGPRRIRIPVSALVLDAPLNWINCVWTSMKEVLSSMVLLWIEPIVDSKSLIDLSIGMLLLERVSAKIKRYEPKTMMEHSAVRNSSGSGGNSGSSPGAQASFPGGILFGAPFIAVLGSFALVLSCLSHAQNDTRLFAPTWVRMLLPRHQRRGSTSSTMFTYLLMLLFCLESLLMISILMFGCHAITFPEWIEEDVKILTSLMGAWLTSLLASSFVRYYLYYSIGD